MNVETTNSCVCVGFCLKVDNSTTCTVFVKNAVKNTGKNTETKSDLVASFNDGRCKRDGRETQADRKIPRPAVKGSSS